jgi:hypothetical protein
MKPFSWRKTEPVHYSSTQVKGALIFTGILTAALWAVILPLLFEENPNWYVIGTPLVATVAFIGGFFQLARVRAQEHANLPEKEDGQT